MAFKMKQSPVKGRLGDFFSNLGKQLKRNRKDIGGEFKGVKQKDKPGGYGSLTDKDKDGMSDFIQAPKKAPKGKEKVSSKPESKGNYKTLLGKPGDKFKYRANTKKRFVRNRYEFQYPEDHEKYKGPDNWETSKTEEGSLAISKLDDTSSALEKRSKGFKTPKYKKRK